MPLPTLDDRTAGLLLHPTSLPGPHGVGDLGSEAHRFLEFLARAGMRFWQMLPTGPTGCGNSPYQSPSSFAGNPLLISLDRLAEEGLLTPGDLGTPRTIAAPRKTVYAAAARFKMPRLRKAFANFQKGPPSPDYTRFLTDNAGWLDDYVRFDALRDAHGGASWVTWEEPLRRREPAALARVEDRLREEIEFRRFLQFQFHRQWAAIRTAAVRLGIGLIGDIPIYTAPESADVWANPEIFALKPDGAPAAVAGVPPDYFSRTGQRWGNPVYRWDVLKKERYAWWADRFRKNLRDFDVMRLDHFIGFARFWKIPAESRTARRGEWMPGPGEDFFRTMSAALGRLPFIAEDLGSVTPAVKALRDAFDFPGMRVLQFAWGGGEDNDHLPRHHVPNTVVYTGTHDNNTTAGWFAGARPEERRHVCAFLRTDGREIARDLTRAAFASPARTAVIPVQDLLGLGSEGRMNVPGTSRGNWEWRLEKDALPDTLAEAVRTLAVEHGRARP
ncbi:MAG: 4-alpha-glucanotransferase [Planctomycetota bacterium]